MRCSKGALLGAALCACTATAWASPILLPAPGASTASPPPPAQSSGAPGPGTSAAPAAATAPKAAPSAASVAKPAAAAAPNPPAPPAKPKPAYSYVDVTALLVQPFGTADVGHGERIAVSDSLSERSFVIVDGARFDSGGEVRHSFDIGLGLNTSDDTGRSLYTTLTWTGVGFQTAGTPSRRGHGYAVAGGIRVMPVASLELDAQARYDNNPALDGHTSGEIGLLYELHPRLWLGLTLGTNAMENDYLLTLRWVY